MTENKNPNQGIIGTFLTGTLGIVTVFILVITLSPFIPWVIIFVACFYLGWMIASPRLRKKNEEASHQVKDDE